MSKSQHIALNPFIIDAKEHSSKSTFNTEGESLTVQADAAATDINNIVKQFGLTHELPYGALEPFYDDITDFPTDYHEAQNFIIASQEAFLTLPSEQRARFDNDPGKFLDFIHNNDNYDEAISLGFVPPRPIETPASDAGNVSPPASDPGVSKP